MVVRLAGIDDVKAMSFIHSQTWKKAYVDYFPKEYLESIQDDGWVPLFSRAMNAKAHEAAVFVDNGIITGTITFGRARNATREDDAEIISLYVLPDFWDTKQGYYLMKFAVDILKGQGFHSIYLWVIKENERATRFYKRFGFRATGELMDATIAGSTVTEEKYIMEL